VERDLLFTVFEYTIQQLHVLRGSGCGAEWTVLRARGLFVRERIGGGGEMKDTIILFSPLKQL